MIIITRKKLKISRHNLSRSDSRESRRDRLSFVYVNHSLLAIRTDNNENDDRLRDNLQFYLADEDQEMKSSKNRQRIA